jgi:predicted dehydrogenase
MMARLVVVGLGRIGRLHAANLAARAELVGVVEAVESAAREVGGLEGVPWWTSLEELPGNLRADGVVIAAPTGLHVELAVQAAEAGLHVFCEKPLGFDPDDARRAVEAARAAGVTLQVGFQRRFDPDWLALRDALASGELGEPRLLRMSHRNAHPPHATADLGDVFVDLAVHDLDAARWLGGEVADLSAQESDGLATISLRFESGALGLIDVGRRAAYGFECSAEIVGSRATARLGSGGPSAAVELLRDGRASRSLPADHVDRHAAAYRAELASFAAAARGEGSPDGARGEDAVAALGLALLARRRARSDLAVA